MKYRIKVVIDPQVDFTTGKLGCLAVNENVPKLAAWLAESDAVLNERYGDPEEVETVGIILTRDTHYPGDYADTAEGKVLPIHAEAGTDGNEFDERVEKVIDEIEDMEMLPDSGCVQICVKEAVMGAHLKDSICEIWRRIWRVRPDMIQNMADCELEYVIGGYLTENCVLANALFIRCLIPAARVIVDADVCADITPERHERALAVMADNFIEVKR